MIARPIDGHSRSPAGGREVQVAAEEAAHMGLVGEAAGESDLGERHLIGEDQVAGVLHALAANERGGRSAEGRSKGMSKARDTQPGDGSKIGNARRRFEIVGNVAKDPLDLPGREAPRPAVVES
jgi:hypothetical protein